LQKRRAGAVERQSQPLEETPLLACLLQIEQDVLHLGRLRLMLLLGDTRTLAHEVCSTDAVRTVRGITACQSVVHASPDNAWPDADLVHGFPASRGMPGQMRQGARAVHMQRPRHADAGLISLLEATGCDQFGSAMGANRSAARSLHCRTAASES
jgi:hypothetical protein